MKFLVTDTTKRSAEKTIGVCEVYVHASGDMMLLTEDGSDVVASYTRARVERVTVTGLLITAFEATRGNNYVYHELYCKAQAGKESET